MSALDDSMTQALTDLATSDDAVSYCSYALSSSTLQNAAIKMSAVLDDMMAVLVTMQGILNTAPSEPPPS